MTDALNHTTTYGYDADRRALTTTNALGATMTLGYDANGNNQTTTDALNHTTTMVNDVMGRPTGNIDALGNRGTVTYDVAGEQLTTTDRLGKQTSQIYDTFKRGLVVESIDGVGSAVQVSNLTSYDALGQSTSARDATGATTTMAYSPGGHALGSTNALGNTNASYYDLAGQVRASRDAVGRWTKEGYDLRGKAVTNTDALGNVGTTAYDLAGNTQSVEDALGRFTTYSYDALNQRVGTLDALGRMTTATFDAVGNTATSSDALGFVTSYAYDAVNQATTTTEAVGTAVQRTTQQAFDAVGNVQASQDALGNWTTNVYDALYRDVAKVDPLGHRTSSVYDAVGSVTSVQDALGKFVTYAYDALHQQISTENALGNFTTMVLDAAGRQVGQINPLLFVDKMGYDALGRKISALDPAGNLTRWVYDGSGGIRLIIDPVGNETRYVEDGLGRQTVEYDPTGAAATTAYDTVGRVSTATDRDGRTMGYSYDTGDRTTGIVWKSAAGATVNLLTYTYDNNDNVLTAADYNGTVTFAYDALNQVQSYTNTFGQVLTYTHDGNGNVTLRQDSLGGVLTSVYDTAQRLTSKQFGGTGQTPVRIDFGYDNRDEQTSKTWYSDLAGTTKIAASGYIFDDGGRLTAITNTNSSSATLSYYNYTYDTADRATTHSWWSQIGTTVYSGSVTYTYDCTGGQLRSETTAAGTTTYTYDGNGNRTMTGYQTGTANRMTNDGTFTYTYDAAGNTITKSKGSGLETWYFGWNNANELTSIRETTNGTTNELTVTYTYDVEHNRIQQDKWLTGGSTATTRYAYDGSNVWADLDGTNAVLTRYVFGDGMDEILTRTVSSGVNAGLSAYLTDSLGSIRDLVLSSGAVNDHIDYSGFGIANETNTSVGDRMKFQGRWDDLDTGTADYRRRVEFITDARFLSVDPTGLGPDINPTRFEGNNSTNVTDPNGTEKIKPHWGQFIPMAGFAYLGYWSMDAYFAAREGSRLDEEIADNRATPVWKCGWSKGAFVQPSLTAKQVQAWKGNWKRLTLNVFQATKFNSDNVKSLMEKVQQYYANYGIYLEYQYNTIPDDYKGRMSDAVLSTTTARGNRWYFNTFPAKSLIFLNDISFGRSNPNGITLKNEQGIPYLALISANRRLPWPSAETLIAHEIGHLLGLKHDDRRTPGYLMNSRPGARHLLSKVMIPGDQEILMRNSKYLIPMPDPK